MAINPNLTHLHNNLHKGVNCCLEGGSRSAKTWSGIDAIIDLCSVNNKLVFNIIRETYNSFKTTLYSDFDRRLYDYRINNPFGATQDIHQWRIWGNKINFIGADTGVKSKFEGVGCDYAWYNEMLDVPKMVFDQQEQRTRIAWWGDWNPKRTDHWVFDLEKRPDVKFLRTTIFDNPFASPAEKKKILGYNPDVKENVDNGTADEYMWKVYGLGERAALEGLIFPNVIYIDRFPEQTDTIAYGLDFGYTNSPCALVKVGINKKDLYLENLLYTPIDQPDVLLEVLKKLINSEKPIWCDSADPQLISYLRRHGLLTLGARKVSGSIAYGIGLIKQYKIHIVKNIDFKREQENYKWRTVGGIALNEPIDDFNHLWDATRQALIMTVRRTG